MEHENHDIAYLIVLSGKHLDPHDGKDQPKDETNHEHVEDTGNSLNQSIDHNLSE